MDKPKATPKDFFLWAGAMLSLWGGVVAFLALIFDYINYAFPDALNYYYSDPYQSGISYEMASLIVLGPVFLILMRVIRRDIAKDPTRSEVWVRRWALVLTLFIAGATMVIDLIVLLTTFLSGEELSVRFLLKVALVLLVAAAGFMHFTADLWGYWKQNPHLVRWVNYSTGLLVVLTIISGFFIVGTPQQARLYRFDTQKVSDLQGLQEQVISFYQQKQKLPVNLSELNNPLSYYQVPMDPQSGASYSYVATGALTFRLCATFNDQSRSDGSARPEPVYPGSMNNSAWFHGVGAQCFDRTIDPELYPPTNPTPIKTVK